ncbi:MAG: LapA family protein [Negativicutes bacterium]|nr:LapA family protein [Negativicutes bacterium]
MAYLFFAFVFALVVAIFAIQNSVPVTVTFFIWNIQTSLVIVILGAATFGAMVILLLATYAQFKLRLALQRAKHRQGELEAEAATLKNRLEQEMAKDMSKNDL